jgi:type I restriction-modification system DNA methylase subunit/restriction endonuclease S subunit
MIIKENFKTLLRYLQFEEKSNIFTKNFANSDVFLKVDFKKEQLEYPEFAGLIVNERQTCNFSQAENAVVFECVYKLLEKGYKPEHIELEPKWKLGHGASGGRADILVKDQKGKPLLIIECKTYGKEFEKAWKETLDDGGQLFSYAQQISETEFLCLYASEFDGKNDSLLVEQRIISHKDNEKILEQGEKLLSFRKASNVKKRYDVWKETYQLEYTETGIFEENIQAYQIGKSKYTLAEDTKPVTDKDKDGKYHRFRTILRQHNIARKETAFEVLVNLFLAKIVDEEENKTALEFYWKGVAYDNYYDFVDRLQHLYQIGMRKFLNDEIMYISNEQIDNAFWTVKNKRNATKKQIQKYFRDLKFFSNNAFSFINVHNERLFNKNAKVLVEIVQMWQNLRLKTKEQNQFLGDMFEFFLDNSIKQSEGQFFTPMPITKFIVMSLPLEAKIQNSSEPLRAIDYACGAGHFLTEYAHQIKPLVEKYKETEVTKYYENIVGIEKEDRLAKVAKVSAYMYGQDQIKILEEDALSYIEQIKSESFDVLVANPPFAVEGFLLNLDDKQKEQYELISTTDKNSNTNNIQCFFIERAKQIMLPGGTVGIIVPSSVLSNSDATHIGTREIILKYFDIVAIVELGSGTFGKTGTNTVVLFLKRKEQKPEPAEHYRNRVADYFESQLADVLQGKAEDKELQEYQDLGLIRKYCEQTELPFDEYIKLFGVTSETIDRLEELFQTDIFKDYRADFLGSTDIKNLKKKPFFKKQSKAEQEEELNKRLINHLFAIETDKLFYFMLAHENRQQVLIVKSPSGNKEQKQFLGYEWSGAKGSEGIKYNGGSTVNDIITPLFDPQNINNAEKINYLIQQNFIGAKPNSNLPELVTYANVADILDFSRKDFNKAFSLTPKKTISIDTKWELVKLGEVCIFEYGKSLPENKRIKGEYPVLGSNGRVGYHNEYITDAPAIIIGRKGSAGATIWEELNCFPIDTTFYVNQTFKDVQLKYLFLILEKLNLNELPSGIGVPGLNRNDAYQLKIPLPPKEVQQQIVNECEAIDKEVEQANATIEKAKFEIEEIVKGLDVYKKHKIENLAENWDNKRKPVTRSDRKSGNIPYYGASGIVDYVKDYLIDDVVLLISEDGANLKSRVTPIAFTAEGKIWVNNHAHILKFKNLATHKLVELYLNHFDLTDFITGMAQPKLSQNNLNRVKVPVPPLPEQKKLVSVIEKLETKINQAKKIVESAGEKKQKVMDNYLK